MLAQQRAVQHAFQDPCDLVAEGLVALARCADEGQLQLSPDARYFHQNLQLQLGHLDREGRVGLVDLELQRVLAEVPHHEMKLEHLFEVIEVAGLDAVAEDGSLDQVLCCLYLAKLVQLEGSGLSTCGHLRAGQLQLGCVAIEHQLAVDHLARSLLCVRLTPVVYREVERAALRDRAFLLYPDSRRVLGHDVGAEASQEGLYDQHLQLFHHPSQIEGLSALGSAFKHGVQLLQVLENVLLGKGEQLCVLVWADTPVDRLQQEVSTQFDLEIVHHDVELVRTRFVFELEKGLAYSSDSESFESWPFDGHDLYERLEIDDQSVEDMVCVEFVVSILL